MNLKQAIARIEELERKVKKLESRPAQQIHYHTHTPAPAYPAYHVYPQYPWQSPWATVGAGVQAAVTPSLTFNA